MHSSANANHAGKISNSSGNANLLKIEHGTYLPHATESLTPDKALLPTTTLPGAQCIAVQLGLIFTELRILLIKLLFQLIKLVD